MGTAAASDVDLWSTFTAKAELLGAAVFRAPSDEAAARLLAEAGAGLVATESLLRRFPGAAAGLKAADGEPAAEVAAAAEFGVAETGSVALNEPQGDRGTCFLAERLWLLVPADQLEPTLDLAFQRLRDLVQAGARHPLLMSGPSRTADIERVLTVGVHGPRALVLVIVGGA